MSAKAYLGGNSYLDTWLWTALVMLLNHCELDLLCVRHDKP